ncbi:tyrosine-type recombinase/integrase [Undibacterium sp. Ren11W]|uniref:tyrosine-type recombinase/integrase n=1 Tax=Undibacterium sp. Ren11W TaxID=3413045 RepID=UPI003BF391AC
MSKENFTIKLVDSFKCAEGKQQSILWDGKTPGLGLRATEANAKSYIFESRLHGRTIRITIGDLKTWPISKAQGEATKLKSLVDQGIDPRQQKIEQRIKADATRVETERQLVTLGDIWPRYIESRRHKWSEWHIRDHENVARRGGEKKIRGKGLTEPGPLASLLDIRLCDMNGKRLGGWLALESSNRPTQASLAFRLLSVFVNWCDSQSELAGLVPPGACKTQHVRDEVPNKNTKEGDSLQREQLAPWFKAVREMENSIQSAYLQILLITGARRRELVALRWEDVDFQWKSLTIRDKVEGERTIPLTPYVATILELLPRRNEWVFSSPAAANGQLTEPTPGHKRALVAAGLPDLTLHGLRRSFGTLAEWCEVPAGVTAQIMGHKPSAIAEKHYRRRPLDLLRQWHEKIELWFLEQAGFDFAPSKACLKIELSK